MYREHVRFEVNPNDDNGDTVDLKLCSPLRKESNEVELQMLITLVQSIAVRLVHERIIEMGRIRSGRLLHHQFYPSHCNHRLS